MNKRVPIAIVRAGLPGLANFDLAPLNVPVDRVVTRVRIHLPEGGVLKIAKVKFEPPVRSDEDVTIKSSTLYKEGHADVVIKGQQLQTLSSAAPFWEIRFAEPRQVDSLSIKKGKNFDSPKLYGICVDTEDAAGAVIQFDNLGVEKAKAKLVALTVKIDTMVREFVKTRRDLKKPATEFKKAANMLLAGVLAAIEMPDADVPSLRELRFACLESMIACLKKVRAPEIKILYPFAKPILSALISRGMPNKTSGVMTVETEASAYLLSTILIQSSRKEVNNNILRGFRKHFWTETQLTALEASVNNTVKRALRRRSNPPYMVRVHGISGPNLHKNAEKYLDHMANVQAALAAVGYDSCICYGTLLGAVRERDFIAHDDDVDLAVMLKTNDANQEMRKILEHLRAAGLKGTAFRTPSLLAVRSATKKTPIDLFPILDGGPDHVQMYMQNMKVRKVARSLVLPMGRIDFLDRSFGAPADPTGFLEDRYGANWGTPVRKVAHRMIPSD